MVHFVSTSCQRYVELEELALLLGRPTTVPGSDAMYQQLLKLTARLDEMSADSLQLRSDVRELKQTQLRQNNQQPKNGAQQQEPQSGIQQFQQPTLTPRKPTTIETAAPDTVKARTNAPKTYAQISSRYFPNQSAKRIASSARAFQETSDPQGYKYLYLPSRNRATCQTIRQKMRTVKVETSRVLDIHFPARNIVALLVHIQYYQELNLNDTKFENLSHPDKCDKTGYDPLHSNDWNSEIPTPNSGPIGGQKNDVEQLYVTRFEENAEALKNTLQLLLDDEANERPLIDELTEQLNHYIYEALDLALGTKPARPKHWKCIGKKRGHKWELLQQAALRLRRAIKASRQQSFRNFCTSLENNFSKATKVIKQMRRRRQTSASFSHPHGPQRAVEVLAEHLSSVYSGHLLSENHIIADRP
ncbi:unnamed protein product [Umbelopsis vinacea]